jgi:beta-glucosidase-like glycosyl hydrolase
VRRLARALLGLLPLLASSAPRTTRALTFREKVAQLVVLPFYGEAPHIETPEYRKYLGWVRDLRIGGLVLVNRVEGGLVRHSPPHALAAFLNRIQRAARTPLLVLGDFERGASMRIECETQLPHSMAFAAAGEPALSREAGAITARQGRLSRRRIETSAARVLAAKARLGLTRRRTVDVEAISEHLDAPQDVVCAQRVAERALTLVKNEGDLLPLRGAACFLVLPENRYSTAGRAFAQEALRRAPKAAVTVLEPAAAEAVLEQAAARAAESEIAAVKGLFGEIPIQGRLPVTIPGQARIGDGLRLAAAAPR